MNYRLTDCSWPAIANLSRFIITPRNLHWKPTGT